MYIEKVVVWGIYLHIKILNTCTVLNFKITKMISMPNNVNYRASWGRHQDVRAGIERLEDVLKTSVIAG